MSDTIWTSLSLAGYRLRLVRLRVVDAALNHFAVQYYLVLEFGDAEGAHSLWYRLWPLSGRFRALWRRKTVTAGRAIPPETTSGTDSNGNAWTFTPNAFHTGGTLRIEASGYYVTDEPATD